MRVIIAYIAVSQGPRTGEFCARFVGSWQRYPPQYPCELIVCANGGPLPYDVGRLFDPLGAKMYPRTNDPGWDISAFCDVARNFDCDMLVCFGESIFFHRAGWLERIVESWTKHGPGMYGLFSSNNTTQHLNTSGFAVDPKLLKAWPVVRTKPDRYKFEHHPTQSFWRHVQRLGKPVKLVTWDGEWGPSEWRAPANIMWKRDQSNCLVFCAHTERYAEARDETKRLWEINADRVGR